MSHLSQTNGAKGNISQVWANIFFFVAKHPAYFQYIEQFSNSPYSELVNKEEVEAYFEPVIRVILTGIELKIIKDVHFDILSAFIFFPIMALANPRHCKNFELSQENMETAFNLSWDAIRR